MANGEQGTGNGNQGTGNGKQGTGNGKQRTVDGGIRLLFTVYCSRITNYCSPFTDHCPKGAGRALLVATLLASASGLARGADVRESLGPARICAGFDEVSQIAALTCSGGPRAGFVRCRPRHQTACPACRRVCSQPV